MQATEVNSNKIPIIKEYTFMNIPLLIAGFVLLAAAAFVNFNYNYIIKKFINIDRINVSQETYLTEEELIKYKKDLAAIKVKSIAFLILLAGIIIILIAAK